jgi:hypothetical protein
MFDRLRTQYVGRHNWPNVTASVSSTEFHEGTRSQPHGYYDVIYTFWIDGHIYEGEYSESATGQGVPFYLKKDDPIEVLYCPSDPNINFNPDFDFIYQHGLTSVFVIAGVVVAAVAVTLILNR